jgi:hypothetical protein
MKIQRLSKRNVPAAGRREGGGWTKSVTGGPNADWHCVNAPGVWLNGKMEVLPLPKAWEAAHAAARFDVGEDADLAGTRRLNEGRPTILDQMHARLKVSRET